MTDASSVLRLLRRKFDTTTDDVDWRANQTTPNELTAVVGGTTTAGVYSINIAGKVYPRTGGSLTVDFTATITRVAETDAQIADALEDDIDAGTINAGSPVLLSTVGITADVSSETITMRFPPNCSLTVTVTAPAPGTITTPLGTVMPITVSNTHYSRSGEDSITGSIVYILAKDDLGATLLAPSTATISGQLIEIMEIESTDSRGDRTYAYAYGGLAVLTGLTFNTPIELPTRGMKYWTFRLLTDASLPAGTDAIDVVHRTHAG
jgi:hypothetical protein